MSTLSINGIRKSGNEVRDENVTAVTTIANIVKNSLGPAGLDKMIVDDVGELNITNDGATILKLIEVSHPAAKILVELAKIQDEEVGDGTTSVVLLASELVKRGNTLIKSSIHPTTVISGFQQAKKMACKFLAENQAFKIENLGPDCLEAAARTAMSSKVIGQAADLFATMAVTAMKRVGKLNTNQSKSKNKITYNVHDVSILKIRGNSLLNSRLTPGVVIERSRSLSSYDMPTSLENCKAAFIDFNLTKEKLPSNIKVVCDDPEELEAIREKEISSVEKRVNLLLDAGVRVIISSRSIDDFVMKVMARKDVIAIKNVARATLKRLATALGGRVITSLATLDSKDGLEKVEQDSLGFCAKIFEENVGNLANLIAIQPKVESSKNNEVSGPQTIVICGPNDYALDEVERSLHDVLCALKRIMESNRVVVGGGVVEAALSVYLENFAETIGSREQLAIGEFATALLVIPKTLAVNGSFDAVEKIANLRAAHNNAILDGNEKMRNVGLNLSTGALRDNLAAGVFEPAMSKIKSIKFATEAAIAILRIDDAIYQNKESKDKGGR